MLGAEIKSATLCVTKNLYTSTSSIFLLGGIKIGQDDKLVVNDFLENQAQTYTCGTDFSELASSLHVSKQCLRPYCQTYSGNLTVNCLHPVDEKLYTLDQHKNTCSQCGDESLNPTVPNQFLLCIPCHEKEWPFKAFTVIAKRVYAKKLKVGNDVQIVDEEIVEEGDNNDDNSDNRNYDKDSEINESCDSNNESDPDDINST